MKKYRVYGKTTVVVRWVLDMIEFVESIMEDDNNEG